MNHLRAVIKGLLAEMLYRSGVLSLALRFKHSGGRETCIFGLHRILTDLEARNANSLNGMVMRAEVFSGLLQHLIKNFNIIAMPDFLLGKLPQSAKPYCVVTFDDGWEDNLLNAAPRLKQFQVSATVFATTGLIGTKEIFWVERLNRIHKSPALWKQFEENCLPALKLSENPDLEAIVERLKHMANKDRDDIFARIPGFSSQVDDANDRMLSWEQLREMSASGFEIGGHTMTHPLLPYEDDITIDRELQESRAMLEERLSIKASTFAYPNGTFDDRVRKKVIEAGYKAAFTTQPGWHNSSADLFAIKRIMIHDGFATGRDGEFSAAMFTFNLVRRG